MAGCGWLALFGPSLMAACKAVMAAGFQFTHADIENFSPFRPLAEAGWKLVTPISSLLAISIIAAILSQAGLGALQFNGALLAPKASRIDPGAGLKRIFGPQGWIELGKSLLKVILLGCIGSYMLWTTSRSTLGLMSSDINSAVGGLGSTLTGIVFAMAFGLLLIAGVDVPVQIIRLLGKLRMSKHLRS